MARETYGEKQDDALRRHPCVMAYTDFTEGEKVCDHNTSVEMVKLNQKLDIGINK